MQTSGAANGSDWMEILNQRQREKEYATKLGLSDPHVADPKAEHAPQINKPVQTPAGALTFDSALAALSDTKAELANLKLVSSRAGDAPATIKSRKQTFEAAQKGLKTNIATLEAAIEKAQS